MPDCDDFDAIMPHSKSDGEREAVEQRGMNTHLVSGIDHRKALDPGECGIHGAQEGVTKSRLLRVVPGRCDSKVVLRERREDQP